MRRIATIAFLACITVFSLFSHAQAQSEGSVGEITAEGIVLTVDPEFPGPGQSVTARLESSTVDLDHSSITWKIDGKNARSGSGERDFSFSAGAVGASMVISAEITTAAKESFTKSVTLRIGSVDLLWQGEGYVPPFYKGRSLWARQNRLTLFAIPQTGDDPLKASYRWKINGEVSATNSGTGKNSLSLTDSLLGLPQEITVDIMSDPLTVAASATVTLNAGEQIVRVYEKDPLLGYLFHKETGSAYLLKGKEVTFAAFPYFFSVDGKSSKGVTYRWSTNGQTSQSTDTVTYRAPESGAGSASVGVTITHINQILQSAGKNFLVQFGNQNGM